MKKPIAGLIIALAIIGFTCVDVAAQPPLYSIEQFFGVQDAASFRLDADGSGLFFARPADGVMNVFRRDLADDALTQLTFSRSHIDDFFLKGSSILFMQDTDGDEIYHIFRVEDGQIINLTPNPGVMAIPVDALEESPDEILVIMNLVDPTVFGLYRLNIFTGEVTPALDWFAGGMSFVADSAGVMRIVTLMDDISVSVMHRFYADDDFVEIGVWHVEEFPNIRSFDENDEFVFAVSNVGRDTMAVVLLDPATGAEVDVLYERHDVDVLYITVEDGRLINAEYYTTFENARVFFDDAAQARFAQIEALLDAPGYFLTVESVDDSGRLAVVSTESDISRGAIYLIDLHSGTLEQLTDRRMGIDPAHMSPMQPIEYNARDGLLITGYLTLPVGVAPTNLPLVVLPHGGPWNRDVWGWNGEVQFLANRGYAVFQPNFRSSAGFGREFLQAGFGQWGLTMQDDITDGVMFLIDAGIADPARIAIYGASYGGYAALAGAAFTPDLYAAAVSYVGISNLFTFLASIPPWWEPMQELFDTRVGNPETDFDRLMATSPLFHADNINIPVFIAHGANDPRVSLTESLNIVDALAQRDVPVELFVAWDEGHGFDSFENVSMFYTILEAFLAEHIGGRTLTSMDDLPRPLFDPAPLADWVEMPAYDDLEIILEALTRMEDFLPDTILEFLYVEEGAYIALSDEQWGIVRLSLRDIPINIDGRQGIEMGAYRVMGRQGSHVAVFDRFSAGLSGLHAAVYIDGVLIAWAMFLEEGGSLSFDIPPADHERELVIVMSTNSAISGLARISLSAN